MKITLQDDSEINLPFGPAAVSGYRCRKIEIDSADVRKIRDLATADIDLFHRCMTQLQARFGQSLSPDADAGGSQ